MCHTSVVIRISKLTVLNETSTFLIPPAHPFAMTSKGQKVPVYSNLRAQELHPCSKHLKI